MTKFGQYIVADPDICHGKPTFVGTADHGVSSPPAIRARSEREEKIQVDWGGRISREAIAEAVQFRELMARPEDAQ